MDKAESKPAPSPATHERVWRSAKFWVLASVLPGLLLLVFAIATKARGPSHAGRPAEDWLRDAVLTTINVSNGNMLQNEMKNFLQRRKASIEAFQLMEWPVVEFLVETLERKDSSWNRIARKLHPKLPTQLKRRIPEPIAADTLKSVASSVLLNTSDPQPEKTFSRLVAMLESPDPHTRLVAWGVVSHYATRYQALNLEPHELQFRRALDDTNHWLRVHAVVVMLRADMAASNMIPALRPALTSGDSTLSNSVQMVIQQLERLPAREP